jgi:hypothetical protein
MPFDPASFEAEVALKLIPTERLPMVAQDALEDGWAACPPHGDPGTLCGMGIDQALPPMLAKLGCQAIPPKETALRLAQIRARRILETGEDPLPSIPYFHQLM